MTARGLAWIKAMEAVIEMLAMKEGKTNQLLVPVYVKLLACVWG